MVLRRCSQFEADFYADRLRAAGIPAEVVYLGPRWASGRADVVVAEADAARAEAVITDESEALPVPEKWAKKRRPWFAR